MIGTATVTSTPRIKINNIWVWLIGVFGFAATAWAQPPAIVINEIHTNPDVATDEVEFVEVYNTTGQTVNLAGWTLGGGISYTFPTHANLPSQSYAVIAANPTRLRQKFGLNSTRLWGPFVGRLNNEGESVVLRDSTDEKADEVTYQLGFPWPTVGDPVPGKQPGRGPSIQLIHPLIDNDLGGSWRSAYPTPRQKNTAVYSIEAPTQIRQVRHRPQEPTSGEPVAINAKVTDADGLTAVLLTYQIVEPGQYIPATLPNYPSTNPATKPNTGFERNWQTLPMVDNGQDGDMVAGDAVYTALLPASLQRHRRLIRYRIHVIDVEGHSLRLPYADDPQQNFAYFVYDSVPAWKGALQPGSPNAQKAKVVTYSREVMQSLPVYHLLSRAQDVQNCQYNRSYDNTAYYFSGTLIYDGKVYDNIHYRVRGQASTFMTGKNKWKVDFNRGHYFQARDDNGKKYRSKWDKLNVGTGTCPWWQYPHPGPWDRGTRGMVMNEALAFRFYNMAGVPSCRTNYFHFRVIDNAQEAHPTNQYEGDFWGLYFTIEHPDGAFLDEHDLADGNVYRMDGGANKTHQGSTQSVNNTDLNAMNLNDSQSGWAQYINLDNYYRSRAVGIAVNDSDRRPNANCIYYHHPDTDQWWMLPWDLDLSFEWATHYTTWENFQNALKYSPYEIAARNRARELLDLLFNGDQAAQVIEEIAAIISTPYNGQTFVTANQALWDYHPRTNRKGQFYQNNEFLISKDWPGMVDYYHQFLTPTGFSTVNPGRYGVYALIQEAADTHIPYAPEIAYAGADGHPINDLRFNTTSFRDPQGNSTFAALQWRLARVQPGASYVRPVLPEYNSVTLLAAQSPQWKYFKGTREPSVHPEAWYQSNFDDSAWLEGRSSIGYGDADDNTELSDMRNTYSSLYLRRRFTVSNPDDIAKLRLRVYVDDGCIIWINGTEIPTRFHVSSGVKSFNDLTGAPYVGNAAWEEVSLSADVLTPGSNQIAIHVLNSSLSSSDISIDVELIAELIREDIAVSPPDSAVTAPIYQYERGKYEIDPIWESPEMTTLQNTVTIPARDLSPGRVYRVRCRMQDTTERWSHWSEPLQFTAGEPVAANIRDFLRVTELMAHPAPTRIDADELAADQDAFEFIELQNSGEESLDLGSTALVDGVRFDFGTGDVTYLAPGEFILVVSNRAAFLSRYGQSLASRIAGEYSGQLRNSGETVRLEEVFNGVIAEFTYGDGRAWPTSADGAGHSLVPLASAAPGQPHGSLNYPGNWCASAYRLGSPGYADAEIAPTIVINEIAPHTDYLDSAQPDYDSNDWIELFNAGSIAVNLAHWTLSDNPDDLAQWPLPALVLAPGQYLLLNEVEDFHRPITQGFGLNKAGEQLFLSHLPGTAEDRVVDSIKFKGVETDTTLSRSPIGTGDWSRTLPTPGTANAPPLKDIMITELMVQPVPGQDEYIELYNPLSQTVPLENEAGPWRLDGAVEYVFPAGISIAPGKRVIIVEFDPLIQSSRWIQFMETYGLSGLIPGLTLMGPWSGALANEGERLSLEMAQLPDLPGDSPSWVVIDEITYAPLSPWPTSTEGHSLQRRSPISNDTGHGPTNWQVSGPTPGQ